MIKIIGVRFRNVGKIYYFNPKDFKIKVGDHVIVETARGVEYGKVVLGPKDMDEEKVVQPLKEVIRIATQKDKAKEEANRKKEKEAFHRLFDPVPLIAGDKLARDQIHSPFSSCKNSAIRRRAALKCWTE